MRTRIDCHNCQHTSEHDLAETALRTICPNCGAVLDLTRSAQSLPGLTDQEKALIGLAGGVVITLLLINLLGGNRKRR